jgi:hypothetical protein
MPLRIDRVDSEIEILRKEADGSGASAARPTDSGLAESLGSVRGRNALREKLRPIIMEVLTDELTRMKRKVGSP